MPVNNILQFWSSLHLSSFCSSYLILYLLKKFRAMIIFPILRLRKWVPEKFFNEPGAADYWEKTDLQIVQTSTSVFLRVSHPAWSVWSEDCFWIMEQWQVWGRQRPKMHMCFWFCFFCCERATCSCPLHPRLGEVICGPKALMSQQDTENHETPRGSGPVLSSDVSHQAWADLWSCKH